MEQLGLVNEDAQYCVDSGTALMIIGFTARQWDVILCKEFIWEG